MKRGILVSLVIMILLSSGSVFAADKYVDISPENSEVYLGYDCDSMDEMLDTRLMSINNSIADSNRSYIQPRIISSNSKTISFYVTLRDNMGSPLTGIKVSRIELIQDDTVIARTNNVESYSISGRYRGRSLEIINSFKNTNGENSVDVVLYLGSKEVARLSNKIIEVYSEPIVSGVYPYWVGFQNNKFQLRVDLMNMSNKGVVDAYLIDEAGNKLTKVDKVYSDYYNSNDGNRSMNLNVSFIDTGYLISGKEYNYIVTVDGKEIVIKDNSKTIEVIDEVLINTRNVARMPDLSVRVTGFNLLQNGPYNIVIEQDGKITKELNDIAATFNEEQYKEEINVELLAEYFDNHGDMYNVKIFDYDGKMLINSNELEPKDDTSQEEDIVDPFEGFKVFDKKEDVEPTKTWKVKFSEALNQNSINNGNAYVVNKKTGLSVKVDYSLEAQGTILTMTPEENFISGETYLLIIDKRIKSETGANLSQPATIEFTVK